MGNQLWDVHDWSFKCDLWCYPRESLKVPKGLSEAVNRRTDDTMTKWKSTNNDLQHYTKSKDWATQTSLNTRV